MLFRVYPACVFTGMETRFRVKVLRAHGVSSPSMKIGLHKR